MSDGMYPEPPQSEGALLSAALPWTPDGAVAFGWQVVKRDPGIVGVLLVGGLCASLVTLVGWFVFVLPTLLAPGRDVAGAYRAFATLAAANLPIQAYFAIGTWRYLLKTARGEASGYGDLFGRGPYVRMLAAMLLQIAGVMAGFAACLVPGLVLCLGWLLVAALIVDKDCGAVEALRGSWRLTRGRKAKLLVLSLLSVGVLLLGNLACLVGVFVAVPVVALAHAYVYLKLTGQHVAEPV